MNDLSCEPRIDDPDTWPYWPTLRLYRLVGQAPTASQMLDTRVPEEGWLVDIEAYHHCVFLVDAHRFHAAVNDPEYPLSNLPYKEYPSTNAILQDGWSPTI